MKKGTRERPTYDDAGRFDGTVIESFDPSVYDAEERDALRRSLSQLLAPIPAGALRRELTALSLVLKAKDTGVDEFRALLEIYAADLANCSTFGVLKGFADIRRSAIFFPTIAELLTEIDRIEKPYRIALSSLNSPQARPKALIQNQSGPRSFRDMIDSMDPETKSSFLKQRAEEADRVLAKVNGFHQAEEKASRPELPKDRFTEECEEATKHLTGEAKLRAQDRWWAGQPIDDKAGSQDRGEAA